VFPEAGIPARRKVVEYTGEKITVHQVLLRARRILLRQRPETSLHHIAPVNRGYAIDGGVGGSGVEFINHCCEPNLFGRRSHGRILFYGKRPIRKGQIAYRFGPAANPIACHCGSPKCR
jgi:SET domain-containing protein